MVRKAFRSIVRFVRLVQNAPPDRTGMEASYEAAKRVREASHVSRGHTYKTASDKLYGKEIAGGNEKARKNTPPPKAR